MRRGLAGLLLVLAACAHDPGSKLPQGRAAARFVGLDGQATSLAAYRGKVLLVWVVTTWNDLALIEVPLLRELHAAHAPDLQILCVALDEDPAMLGIFANTFDLPFPVVRPHDPARFTGPEGPLGPIGIIPTSALLNRGGEVEARADGTWTPAVLQAAVRELIQEGP